MGPEVDTTRFKVGDRVGTLNYYHPCGTLPETSFPRSPLVDFLTLSFSVMGLICVGVCADCKNEKEGYVYCQREQKTLGLTMDGGFSEYMITDSLSAFHISPRRSPSSMPRP